MMAFNPFKPAEPVARKVKVLLVGPAGSGKTTAALTFPRCAVIDTEGGTDLYAGRPGFAPFDVLRVKTLAELEQALNFLKSGKHDYETVVIDSMTVLYEVKREALARASKSGEMSYREWGKLNNGMEALDNTLTDLDMHVVIVARESTEYEGTGDSLRKIGTKPDAHKSLIYNVDFVIQMLDNRTGRVKKSRGQDIAREGATLPRVDWSVFAPLAEEFSDGEEIQHVNRDDAITAEVLSDVWPDNERAAWGKALTSKGWTKADIYQALGVDALKDFKGTRAEADARIAAAEAGWQTEGQATA
jgi:hypothetical protein